MRFIFDFDDQRLGRGNRKKGRFSTLVLIWCSLLVGFAIGFPASESTCSEGMPPKNLLHEDVQAGMDSNNQETNPSMVFLRDGVPDYDVFTDYVAWPTLVLLCLLLLGD
jgi:hypothetical protein